MLNKRLFTGSFLLFLYSTSGFAMAADENIDSIEKGVEENVEIINENEVVLNDIHDDIEEKEQEISEINKDIALYKQELLKKEKVLDISSQSLEELEREDICERKLECVNSIYSAYGIDSTLEDLVAKTEELKANIQKLEAEKYKYSNINEDLEEDKAVLETENSKLEEKNSELKDMITTYETEQKAKEEFVYSGNSVLSASEREAVMKAAGISEADYENVDYIISRESGWNFASTNGAGAYGLCQAVPGSKMSSSGSDWQTNPVTQLRWCDSYATGRYGSWSAALDFWNSNHWW